MKKTLHVTNKSVEQAGLPKDMSHALADYIWNGLDAGASEVKVEFEKNLLGAISALNVVDNGSGIAFENIDKTFGVILDSQKRSIAGSASITGNRKGKGRFSFDYISQKAKWETVYRKDDKNFSYEIQIDKSSKDDYTITEPVETKNPTGTSVTFIYPKPLALSELSKPSLVDDLKREFGWYLHLIKDSKKAEIILNNEVLNYKTIIVDSDTQIIEVSSDEGNFKFEVNFIEWSRNIGEKYYYYYFLNNEYIQTGKKATSFNDDSINFHHSVYIKSDYFNSFTPVEDNLPEEQLTVFSSQEVFKELVKNLKAYLETRRKLFIQRNSETLITQLEVEGVMPVFGDGKYDQERKKDFDKVTTALFKIEPRLFVGVGKIQKQSFLGLLNLLLDTNERNNIITIIEGLVTLTSEERKELAEVLRTTSFNKIVRTVKETSQRYKNIEVLKKLVFELEKYTNERDNIQKIMEDSFWLFGEQYHLVTADKSVQKSLEEYYIKVLAKDKAAEVEIKDKKKRLDIFLARVRPISTGTNTLLQENVIIELKRPSVKIGMKQYRQVEDYLQQIKNIHEFNSETRMWKFYVVGNELEEEVQEKIRERQKEGKEQFLMDHTGNYSIYELTWDDLFQSFELRNNFLFKNLDFDRNEIIKQLESDGVDVKDLPEFLTKNVLSRKSSQFVAVG